MKKILIIVGAVVILCVGGYFIYDAIWGDYNDAMDQYDDAMDQYNDALRNY